MTEMLHTGNHFSLVLGFCIFIISKSCICAHGHENGLSNSVITPPPRPPATVNVGALLAYNTTMGRVAKQAIEMAVEDVNNSPSLLNATQLLLTMMDSNCSAFIGTAAALELMKKNNVAIVGPQFSVLAHIVSSVANELHIPVLSFGATDPTLSSLQYPYFLRMAHSDLYEMTAVAAVIGNYDWKNIVAVYIDDDYGRNGISALSDVLGNVGAKIVYKAALPPGASKNEIGSVMVELALLESRIFVVHMNPDAGLNLFSEALYLGMLSNGYVWIATDWLSSALDSTTLDYDTMNSLQGVISLRRHIPLSDQEHAFIVRWNNLNKAGSVDARLNAFGLYAYDAVWAIAHSIDTFLTEGGNVSFTDYPQISSASGSKTELAKLKVFGGGPQLQNILLQTNFTGLTGPVNFNKNGDLLGSTFEIINIVGTGYRKLGYWTNQSGLSVIPPDIRGSSSHATHSGQKLYDVIWPGENKLVPRGWALPNNGKHLLIGVPRKVGPIPAMAEGKASGNYLSLRRLMVWLAEPTVRIRLMAVLVDDCKNSRGGAMAGAIHMHAQHGDPLVQDFMRRLLRRVCSPLFEMVRSWVLEGELNDIFSEFFVVGQVVKAEALWRDGYQLHSGMLPSFIPEPLAKRILRTGKSINFLRVCCKDQGWADAAAEAASAAGTSTRRGGLGYGETEALEILVVEAAKRIDRHLIEIMYGQFKFRDHCLAIKRYLLLGQGDFIQYLMDIVGSDLSQPANTISSFKLSGLLESAIRASNAQYDDPDILDRLRVKMMPHHSGDRGWDVFSLEYNARDPLNTIFTESVMARYLKIFNFLWKLKRVEHALSATWQTMKPNCSIARLFASKDGGGKQQLVAILRRCQTLRNEMNHFVTNLQYYIMFEVLEYSWVDFSDEMEEARDLDELIVAHERYLNAIVEKSLLGDRSHHLNKTLFALFDLILRFRSHGDRLYESAREMQARGETYSRQKSKREPQKMGSWVSGGRKSSSQLTGEFLRSMGEEMDAIAVEYSSLLEGFIAQLPLQQHVDLKFLLFRLDFTEFYSKQLSNTLTTPTKSRRTSLRGGKQSQNA